MSGEAKKMTATFESGKGNTLEISMPEVAQTGTVLEAYWADKNQAQITELDFEEKAYVIIRGTNLVGKKVIFRVYETDFGPGNDDFIWKKEWEFEYDETELSFNVTPGMFVKGEEDLVYFYFTLEIDEEDEVEYCYSDAEYLKIHLVRYVPGVLRAKGWNVGAELQEEWFSREVSKNPDDNPPNLDIVTMSWALGFTEAKTIHDRMINNKVWVSTKGKPALVKEIKRMVTDGKLTLPTQEDASVAFGEFGSTLISHNNATIPEFDKYHYQELACEPAGMFATLDDLIAALANFVFRMSAGGTITKTKTGFKIEVTTVATYIRDSFDFIDPNPWLSSQDLGYWNIEKKEVSKTPGSGYRLIENSSYQQYQDEIGMGGDFRLFSDIKFTTVSDSFDVTVIA